MFDYLSDPVGKPGRELVRDSWVREHDTEPADSQNWAHEFLNDVPYDGEQVEHRPVHHPDWVHEFVNDVPLPPSQTSAAPSTDNIWADEFLEHFEKKTELVTFTELTYL